MKDLNQYTCTCRVGKQPEVRHLDNGSKVANFSVAVSKSYKNKSGETVESTTWLNIVAWRGLAEVVERFINKGDKLAISGELTTRTWEGNDGVTKYITEIVANDIVMLGGKSGNSQQSYNQEQPSSVDEDTDDLPF